MGPEDDGKCHVVYVAPTHNATHAGVTVSNGAEKFTQSPDMTLLYMCMKMSVLVYVSLWHIMLNVSSIVDFYGIMNARPKCHLLVKCSAAG